MKPAGVTEEQGEKCSQVSAAVSKIQAKFLLPFQSLKGRKCRKFLLGNWYLSNSAQFAKGANFASCHSRVLHSSCATVATSGLGVRAENCSALFFPQESTGPILCPTGKTPLAQSFLLHPGQRTCGSCRGGCVACTVHRDLYPLLCCSWVWCCLPHIKHRCVAQLRTWQVDAAALLVCSAD